MICVDSCGGTKEEVHVLSMFVCLSVSKIRPTQKRVHKFE